MTLPGKSRRIVVVPVERPTKRKPARTLPAPREPEPRRRPAQPERQPARRP